MKSPSPHFLPAAGSPRAGWVGRSGHSKGAETPDQVVAANWIHRHHCLGHVQEGGDGPEALSKAPASGWGWDQNGEGCKYSVY